MKTKTTLFLLENLTMPKTVKGGLLRFFNIHSVSKFQKTEGGLFEVFRKIFEQTKKFQQSHGAEKSEKRGPLGFSNIRSVVKYQTN